MFTHQSAVCLGEHKIPPASGYDIRYDDLSLCFHSLLLQNSVSKRALCYCGRVSFVARSVFYGFIAFTTINLQQLLLLLATQHGRVSLKLLIEYFRILVVWPHRWPAWRSN